MKREDFLKQYQRKEWYDVSKRIKARDNNTCQMCGRNDRPLAVHHLYYPKSGDICDVPDDTLITLCEDCHKRMHYWTSFSDILSDLRTVATGYTIHCLLSSLQNGIKEKTDENGNKTFYVELRDVDLDDDDYNNSFLEHLYEWREKNK